MHPHSEWVSATVVKWVTHSSGNTGDLGSIRGRHRYTVRISPSDEVNLQGICKLLSINTTGLVANVTIGSQLKHLFFFVISHYMGSTKPGSLNFRNFKTLCHIVYRPDWFRHVTLHWVPIHIVSSLKLKIFLNFPFVIFNQAYYLLVS